MKTVYIIRHAPKDEVTGKLTPEAKKFVLSLQNKYKQYFSTVIASEISRTQETALLLTGKTPKIDTRANIIPFSTAIYSDLIKRAKYSAQKVTGVIYEDESLFPDMHKQTKKLISLIKETYELLDEQRHALIVSHDVVMVPTYQTLKYGHVLSYAQQFKQLTGFTYKGKGVVGECSFLGNA